MAKQKFNFNKIISTESQIQNDEISEVETIVKKLDEKKQKTNFELKTIPRKKIRENLKNNYPKVDMESLKESILKYGLLQNIVVLYLKSEDMYVVEAGHRRLNVLDELIQEYANWDGDLEDVNYQLYLKNIDDYKKGYPCKLSGSLSEDISYDYDLKYENLENIPDEVIESEIRVIISNEESRNSDVRTKASNVERLTKLYNRKKIGMPKNEKININKQIASDLGISLTQVKAYKNISNLIPELKKEFEDRKITLEEGSNFSKLSNEEQLNILKMIQSGDKVSVEEVELLKKEKEQLTKKIAEKEKEILKIKEETEKQVKEIKNKKEEEKTIPGQTTIENNFSHILPEDLKEKDAIIKTITEEKDAAIQKLNKEIQALKDKPLKATMSPKDALLAKAEIKIKTVYEDTKKAIHKLLDEIESFEKITSENSVPEELGIISLADIEKQKKELIILLEKKQGEK